MVKFIYTLVIQVAFIAFHFMNMHAQNGFNYSKGELYQCIAPSGLKLRSGPNTNSQILQIVSFGDTVVMADSLGNTHGRLKVDDISGYWVKVKSMDDEGYMFSGYLQPAKYPVDPLPEFAIALQLGTPAKFLPYWYAVAIGKDSIWRLTKVSAKFHAGNVFIPDSANDNDYCHIFYLGSRRPLDNVKLNPFDRRLNKYNCFSPGPSLLPGGFAFISYDQTHESYLSASGEVLPAENEVHMEPGGAFGLPQKVRNYQIKLVTSSQKDGRNESIIFDYNRFIKEYAPEGYWNKKIGDDSFLLPRMHTLCSGDIDGDGKMDLILVSLDPNPNYYLFLTSQADNQEKLKLAAYGEDVGMFE